MQQGSQAEAKMQFGVLSNLTHMRSTASLGEVCSNIKISSFELALGDFSRAAAGKFFPFGFFLVRTGPGGRRENA